MRPWHSLRKVNCPVVARQNTEQQYVQTRPQSGCARGELPLHCYRPASVSGDMIIWCYCRFLKRRGSLSGQSLQKRFAPVAFCSILSFHVSLRLSSHMKKWRAERFWDVARAVYIMSTLSQNVGFTCASCHSVAVQSREQGKTTGMGRPSRSSCTSWSGC